MFNVGFRSCHSYKAKDVVAEFPPQWFEGLAPARYCSAKYDVGVNQYGVKCGGDLHMWESHGWINKDDPYGWFQVSSVYPFIRIPH